MGLHAPATSASRSTLIFGLLLVSFGLPPQSGSRSETPSDGRLPVLLPTEHPPLPGRLSEMWLAPAPGGGAPLPAAARFLEGVRLHHSRKYAEALPLVSAPALASTPLADYAAYYTGVTLLRLDRPDEARRVLADLRRRPLKGYLAEAAVMAAAAAEDARGDHAAAARLYERLLDQDRVAAPEQALYRLGRARLAAGDRAGAAQALLRVYYDYPISEAAASAARDLRALADLRPSPSVRSVFQRELARAERLFGVSRYAEAQAGFRGLRAHASGGERELIDLRIAAADFHLKRYAAAREGVRPYLDKGGRQDEARFVDLAALRALGSHQEFEARVRELARAFPASPWTEDALDRLGTHYILTSREEESAAAFGELYGKFPSGRRAERAAWKYGWWEYKNGRHAETARVFESASATFPRSDYRPAWLYWSARSHARLGNRDAASRRYALVVTDYGSSYYGRLAAGRLRELGPDVRTVARSGAAPAPAARPAVDRAPPAAAAPPASLLPRETESLIRVLIAAGLYEEAVNELRYAQRVWGNSPAVEASLAWVYNRQGDLRRAINLMKRAYPHYLTDGDDRLPADVLKIIFPLEYWELIRKHSAARGLDPYLMAALVAQESTFSPTIRSSANAYGLMQIIPGTGRRIAQSMGLRPFQMSMLTDPETNIRIGTTYFARLKKQFGAEHLALAGYNAGEHRVARWLSERPGLEQDEFIDDIPFPETQGYVKRILGTREDYRRLYGPR